MSKCPPCKRQMLTAATCTAVADGNPYVDDDEQRCHDCGVKPGGFHHPGCDAEALAMALYPLINLRGRTHAFATGSDLSGQFERMMARVTSTPARDEGTIQVSINPMDDNEIAWVAKSYR
jgi:hypothetical protein